MSFDPEAYGPEVSAILALDGAGERLMPLAYGTCSSPEALTRLRSANARKLFPNSRAPEAALSGLYLYFSCLDESHSLSQEIHTPDGSFWHGIMHRQEPDAGNSSYWFNRVGRHAIFPALRAAAQAPAVTAGIQLSAQWDPYSFIDLCEKARRQPGSAIERAALEIQRLDWQLLFDHCARVGQ